MIAYYWEKQHVRSGFKGFLLPELWWGVAGQGLLMSLDEITILHENLFWREIRHASAERGGAWQYLTQWQILFIPLILLFFSFNTLFFINRFGMFKEVRKWVFVGIGCILAALSLEGARSGFKAVGADLYLWAVMLEESLEMAGAICLSASIFFYILEVSFFSSSDLIPKLKLGTRFFTKRSMALLFSVFLALTLSGAAIYGVASNLADREASKVWFNDVQESVEFGEQQGLELLGAVVSSLREARRSVEGLPNSLKDDRAARIVFLSVSDAGSTARVVMGAGVGIRQAVDRSFSQIRNLIPRPGDRLWIKLDIVKRVTAVKFLPEDPVHFEAGLEGVAFNLPQKTAFLPEQLISNSWINIHGASGPELRKKMFAASDPENIFKFQTAGFFSDGQRSYPLYRGHRRLENWGPETLLGAARMAGDYLVRSVDEQGRFTYAFDPSTAKAASSYNVVRHAGTLYSMCELYAAVSDEKLLGSVRRAAKNLVHYVRPFPAEDDRAAAVVDENEAKLGASALTVVALAKYIEVSGDTQYLQIMKRLGLYLEMSQLGSGDFICKRNYPDGKTMNFTSGYYPGEAILALTRLYALDPQEHWLDAAEKGAAYLIEVRDKGKTIAQLLHDHWLLMALNELRRLRPDPAYSRHAFKVVEAILTSQNLNPLFPDQLGSYGDPPRSTPAATRSEGLIAAYHWAQESGSSSISRDILKALKLSAGFQLLTQFQPESSMYFPAPQKSLGAFHASLTVPRIRIDYNQHNISSLLGLYRILVKSGTRT